MTARTPANRKGSAVVPPAPEAAASADPFDPELATIAWIQQEVRENRALPLAEVEAVAGSLLLRLRQSDGADIPWVRGDTHEDFQSIHALNVSLLSMVLAEFMQFDREAVARIGVAGMLHDIGMTRVPPHIVGKPGQVSTEEREVIMQHPLEGARIILEADVSLDMAAIVAYEHHMKSDGSGYPRPSAPRAPHYVSRLVQLCDIYHALRSPRPFRAAWPAEIVASFLSERAGFEYHPSLTNALITLMQRIEPIAA